MTDDELLDVAVEAARAAGALLLGRYGGERALAAKSSPTDLVSEADLAAERAIRDVLAARVPDDAIMGEEGDDVDGTSGRRWIVDPIDGTINFLYGMHHWCISIACEGRAGVILDPLRRELFTATASGEALVDGRPARARGESDLGHALVATGFGYRADVRVRQAEIVERLLPRVRDIRRAGSAALDLAWLAAGRYDAYYEFGVQVWDTAAGELLCRRAGLEVVALDGDGVLPDGVLVAPPALVGPLRELIGR